MSNSNSIGDPYPQPNEWYVKSKPTDIFTAGDSKLKGDGNVQDLVAWYREASDFDDSSTVRNTQVGGSHYKDMTIQPWDAMEQWMTQEEFQGFLAGNVIKYLARHKAKGGTEDLKKAKHYLDKLIDLKENKK